MKICDKCKYTKTHEWVRVDGDEAIIGITDYAQEQMGDIVFVELPETGVVMNKLGDFAVIDSVKATSDIYMPIDVEITDVNSILEESPELLNKDAYKNWIIKGKILNKSQLDELLEPQDYEILCEEQED